MALYERISQVVSFTLLGLVIYFIIELPTRTIELVFLGTPLTLTVSQRWLMALLVGGLAGTGSAMVASAHPSMAPHRSGYLQTFMLLPALLVILIILVLPLLVTDILWWVAGIWFSGCLLWLTILAEYHTIDPRDRWYELSHFWLNLVGFGVAFGFFVLIYQTRMRSIVTGTAMALVGGLLAAALLRTGPEQTGRTWLYAGVNALVMAQAIWAFNYWRIAPLTAGFWLLLIFYLFVGLAQQQILGRLTRQALIEFASIAAIGLIAIMTFAP
ncbi:MAG: hypothetical protein ACP5R2_04900 [Anaerolineae bacterium]